jgi:hypothetical protein
VTRARRAESSAPPDAEETALGARPVTPAPPPSPIILGAQQQTPAARLPGWRPNGTRDLLRASHWSIGEIAEEVGYANPFYFSTRFRRYFGCSPTHYRTHEPIGIEEASWAARPVGDES